MPKKGTLLLAGVPDRLDLALGAAHAEAARHQDAVDRVELGEVARLQLGRVDEDRLHPHAGGDAAVHQRLVEALVALGQLDVLADDADADLALARVLHPLDDRLPLLEARGAAPDVEAARPACRRGPRRGRRAAPRRWRRRPWR